jgi:hypothetical protein
MDEPVKLTVKAKATLVKWDGEPPPRGQTAEPLEIWVQEDGQDWKCLYRRGQTARRLKMAAMPEGGMLWE